MNSASQILIGILLLAILVGARRWALLGLLTGMATLPLSQYLVVGGLSFYPMRLMVIASLVRVIARGEWRSIEWQPLDKAVVLLYAYSVVVYCLRTDDLIQFQIGWGADAVFGYLSFRALVRDAIDLRWLLRGIAPLLLALGVLLSMESLTFRNQFSALGGVELAVVGDLWVRDGRLRAVGAFGHPSLAGTVAGTFLPLYIGLYLNTSIARSVALLGAASCLLIVWACNSGAPLTCVVTALIGWMCWPLRTSMAWVRRGLLAALIALGFVMKAPIWYLIARVSNFVGGGGYHRAALMEVAFANLDLWWFAGMSPQGTKHWLPYTNSNTGVVDLTNTYLNFGISAGLGAMGLFIVVIVLGYKVAGQAMAAVRAAPDSEVSDEPLLWGLGVALTVHVLNWFSITYWDQTSALPLLHLAMIGSLGATAIGRRAAAAEPIESDTQISTREARQL